MPHGAGGRGLGGGFEIEHASGITVQPLPGPPLRQAVAEEA